ncbi:MAG: LOG family protein, partial [Candidatus Babeliales bacterium]
MPLFFVWMKRSFFVVKDLIIITFQLLYGLWYLCRLKEPIVTVFGGARLAPDDVYAGITADLSHKLVEHGLSVLTGGGPGVMQAANCGAMYHKKDNGLRSMGIGVEGLGEGANSCVQKFIIIINFPARKWLLTRYSMAYVVMPGGFG